jgi:hypothetical protein
MPDGMLVARHLSAASGLRKPWRIAFGVVDCQTLLTLYQRRIHDWGFFMARKAGSRFWVRLTLAAMSAALLVVTLTWHDWIEIVFRVDPDHGSGWLEWLIVILAFGLTLTFSVSARQEWRRHALAVTDGRS